MSTARDDADTNADADELLRLIMSGQRPKAVVAASTETSSLPGLPAVGISPVDADPFWAEPPAASTDTAPRVEALFTRGVTYQAPDSATIETEDIASIGEEAVVAEFEPTPIVEELAPTPMVDERAEEVETLSLEHGVPESTLVIEAPVIEAPVIEAPVIEAPKRKPSSFRPLPTPTSRTLGADYVRDIDELEMIESTGPDDTSQIS